MIRSIMMSFRSFFISAFGFFMGLFVVSTWLLFINAPLPQAQASGSNLLSKKCQPAVWVGAGPQTSRGDFKAIKTITCDVVLDHRDGNPETLQALVLHDLETGARTLIAAPHDVVLAGKIGGKASAIELIHERTVAGNDILAQDEAIVHSDASHFSITTSSEQVLRGNFFASQLKSQNREVVVERLAANPNQADCGHFRVSVTMGIEFQKTVKTVPPMIFSSDAESLATKAFDLTVTNTLEELGRRL